MFRFILLLLPCLLFGATAHGQTPSEAQAEALAAADDPVAAATLYLQLALDAPLPDRARYLLEAGTLFRRAEEYDAALKAFEGVTQLGSSEAGVAVDSMRALAHHLSGVIYYLADDLPAAAAQYRAAIDLRDKRFPEGHNDRARSRYNLAIVYRLNGQLDSAAVLLQSGQEIYAKLVKPDTLRWIRTLNYLGLVQRDLRNRQLVQSSTAMAVQLTRQYYRDDPDERAKSYYNAVQCFEGLNMPQMVIALADSARFYYQAAGNQERVVWSLNALATGYLEEGNYSKAMGAFNEALQLLGPDTEDLRAYIHHNLSLCLEQEGNFGQALANAEQAVALNLEGGDSLSLAQNLVLTGRINRMLQRFDPADQNFSQALQYLLGNEAQQIPPVGAVTLDRLRPLADLLDDRAQLREQTGQLSEALEDYNYVFSLQDRIRTDLNNEMSQRYISEHLRPFFQRAIRLHHQLATATGDKSHYWEALQLAERSKAFSLISALQRGEGDQPRRERELRERIAELERSTQSPTQQEQLAAAQLELDRLLSLQQEGTPISPPQLDLAALKNYLSDRELHLFEFAIGEEYSYLFYLSPRGELQMEELKVDATFPKLVNRLRQDIANSAYKEISLKSEQAELDAAYAGAAREVYAVLFASGKLPDVLPQKMLIIPDGYLGFVPFGALLTEEVAAPLNYATLPYLQRGRQLSYSYSAEYLLQLDALKRKEANAYLLALAPSFRGNAALKELTGVRSASQQVRGLRALPGLLPLQFNRAEVEEIASLMPDTKAYLSEEATRGNFLKEAPWYAILHLSSHALVNADDPNQSFIAFSQLGDSLETEEILFLNDLYALDLRAELAVLSACETSMGQYAPGEGVLSLARAFAQAGAASTLTTLWKVDDEATKELMVRFYENLLEAPSRAAALSAAQSSAMADPVFAHPYYWSALTLYGRMDQITIPNGGNRWTYLGIAVGLVIGVLIGRDRLKKKQRDA